MNTVPAKHDHVQLEKTAGRTWDQTVQEKKGHLMISGLTLNFHLSQTHSATSHLCTISLKCLLPPVCANQHTPQLSRQLRKMAVPLETICPLDGQQQVSLSWFTTITPNNDHFWYQFLHTLQRLNNGGDHENDLKVVSHPHPHSWWQQWVLPATVSHHMLSTRNNSRGDVSHQCWQHTHCFFPCHPGGTTIQCHFSLL